MFIHAVPGSASGGIGGENARGFQEVPGSANRSVARGSVLIGAAAATASGFFRGGAFAFRFLGFLLAGRLRFFVGATVLGIVAAANSGIGTSVNVVGRPLAFGITIVMNDILAANAA